jgi:uncharacterized membrane protein HdeD (DUF308 family)
MKSHTKWGLFFVVIGVICMLLPFFSPLFLPLLLPSFPFIVIGLMLIIFGKREEKIEEVRE